MKTIKSVALAIVLFAIFNSCTDGDSMDYSRDPVVYDQINWYTEDLEVVDRNEVGEFKWELVGDMDEIDSYYECIIDGFPYVDGIINVYLYQNFGKQSEIQIPLPYTYYGVEILENGNENYYSIQYSYDIARDGTIALKVHVSDYYTGSFRPGTEHFRVAIIW